MERALLLDQATTLLNLALLGSTCKLCRAFLSSQPLAWLSEWITIPHIR